MTLDDLTFDYLRNCLTHTSLVPYPFDGEDRNLRAFRSKEELVPWYSQPPGKEGEPYRDRGFYCRELAMLSISVYSRKPGVIVEFGTSLGIGTCLLHWLNPMARLVTVDINDHTYLPGGDRVPMGYLARWQSIPCEYARMPSWEYALSDVALCFIDADHSYESVLKDSERAWNNRCPDRWAIAWHDYNERHPGVVRAVDEFCKDKGILLQSREDSDTVWAWGEKYQ